MTATQTQGPAKHRQGPGNDTEVDALARLGVAVARLSRRFRFASAGHGLTPSQLTVLAAVTRQGSVGMAELAASERLNPTLLSRIVGELEGRSLVRRAPAAEDRRCIVVKPTAAGRRLQERVRAERTAALRERLDELSAAEVKLLLAAVPALERLAGERIHGQGAA